jgi:hypothetical protein
VRRRPVPLPLVRAAALCLAAFVGAGGAGSLGGALRDAHAQSAPTDQQKAAARAAAGDGIEAFKQGKYEKALELLQRAEAVIHAPTHVLMIARSHAALRQLVEASEAYLAVTREELDPKAPAAFRKAKDDAKQELAELSPRIPTVVVRAKPEGIPGLAITVDGKPMPSALVGLKQPINPGKHTYRATAPGYLPREAESESLERSAGEVELALAKDPSAPEAASSPSVAPSAAPGGPVAPPGAPKPRGLGGGQVAGIALLSVGIAGAGAAGAFLGLHLDRTGAAAALFDAECVPNASIQCPAGSVARQRVEALDSEAATFGNVAVGAAAGGGTLLAVGAILFAVSGPKAESSARLPWLVPVLTSRSIGVAGSF